MIKALFTATGPLLLACYLGGVSIAPKPRVYTFQHENVLGTSLELKIAAPSPKGAETAEAAALAEIARQAGILSSYDPDSEFSRWFRTSVRPVRVSAELFETLSLFDQWRARTDGALDPAAEAICRVWKSAAAAKRVPSKEELAGAVAEVRRQHWKLDAANRTATHLSGVPLVLNSFAKSYIVNRSAEAALAAGNATAVVVNIGGDLVVRGAWTETVDVADPLNAAENAAPIAHLAIHDRAVATSGSYRRGVEIAGRHYSHIVDPRTGEPADSILSATVIAPSPADAGALATAFSVMTPDESRRLAATMPGVEYLLIQKDGARVQSPGWRAFAAPPQKPRAIEQEPAGAGWELAIDLELARTEGRRPYVAVWIEDKDRFPVRTVALWFRKPRWLPEMRAWYRDDRTRARVEGTEIAASVSSATRPPGRYTLKWDGKDNRGRLVTPGRYTVCIEAAREHGTYQIIRQEMDFAGAPRQVQLPGNVEIASASLDYHKLSR